MEIQRGRGKGSRGADSGKKTVVKGEKKGLKRSSIGVMTDREGRERDSFLCFL